MTASRPGEVDSPTAVGSPAARLRSSVRRAQGHDPAFGPADAVAATRTADVAHFLHPHFETDSDLELLGTGVPASPGAASGRMVLTAEEAVLAGGRGESVILVRRETSPEDVLGMQAAAGILTARGGLASHAAVVARGWGLPAVVGFTPLVVRGDTVVVDGRCLPAGSVISIDGHSGEVFAGETAVAASTAPPELDVLLGWADAVRAGRFGVRGNADDGAGAVHARALGADGIGLCRTEHMFLAADRLPLVRRLILSDDPALDAATLEELEEVQCQDFEALLRAMDGLPVTVRLLDPPLHEFLPDLEPLVVREALGQLDDEASAVLAAVRRLYESNPMIGTRGVRLGLVKPGLYPMQVRAVGRAVLALRAAGLDPKVEVMIPLVVDASELRMARRWVEEAAGRIGDLGAACEVLSVGTMVETPRAALLSGELATVADFLSFGTNDLTQLTFAFSRDDVEGELLPRYFAAGLLADNPFEVLDQAGVGFLVRHAIDAARAANPAVKIGACGEQAGDPTSAAFLVASGLDYVSCSPFRLPVVRLAVAQALLALGLGNRPTTGDQGAAPGAGEDRERRPAPGGDLEFEVRHALRVRTFATTAALSEMTGIPEATIGGMLDRWVDDGHVRHHQGRGFWQLTASGRTHHQSTLPGASPEAVEHLRVCYPLFLSLNGRFKELCTAWQLRGGEPNDHADGGYDRERIEELCRLDRGAGDVLGDMAGGLPRMARYRDRLGAALARVAGGERDAFTGVMKASYHDVWMELHEDLLCVLGIDRSAEGSA